VLILAFSGNVIAPGPKSSGWKLLGFFLDPGRGLSLENLNDIGNGIFG